MLIPFSTDAPVYHWPVATVGLIVANIALFFGVMFGDLGGMEDWILWYGDGLHPDQWLRSIFMHGSLEHLIGNMLFLWVFGLVVEGKIGWWQFLACYLSIGLLQSAAEQALMLAYSGDTPGSLGASAAIFGVMAIAAIWAPMNEVTFLWLLMYRTGTFDVSIVALAALYAGLEVLLLLLSGGQAGSSWLHLGGFVLGVPIGIVLLKRGNVDCEGWDLFHVWRGDYGPFKQLPDSQEDSAKLEMRRQDRDRQMLEGAGAQLNRFLADGNWPAALLLYEKMKGVGKGLTLDRRQLLAIIQGLHSAKRWGDSAPLMAELISQFPEGADLVRIKLAQICVVELQRPGKALELLGDVRREQLSAEQIALVKRIAAKARQLQQEGTVELDTEAW